MRQSSKPHFNSRILLLYALLSGMLGVTGGQTAVAQEYVLESFTGEQGLPQSQVWDALQSRRGEIWLALYYGGIARFDGHNFTRFDHEEGLSEQTIQSQTIYEDRTGVLWFGMQNGLHRYDGLAVSSFSTLHGLPSNDVRSIVEDRSGLLWIGTDLGICSFDGSKCKLLDDARIKDIGFKSLSRDLEGNLWIGSTTAGLFKYDGKSIAQWNDRSELKSSEVNAVTFDRNQIVWIGTHKGLVRFDGESFERFDESDGLPDSFIRSLSVDRAGILWVGTNSGLARRMGDHFVPFAPKTLATIPIRSVMEDRENNIWISTDGKGIFKYAPSPFTHYSKEDGLAGNMVWGISEGPGENIWISLQNGISQYDGITFKAVVDPGGILRNREVTSMFKSGSGALWLGMRSSLMKYENGRFETFQMFDGVRIRTVTFITEDAEGHIWLATPDGAIRYDGKNFTRYPVSEGNENLNVTSILAHSNGSIWAGTESGLFLFNGTSFSAYSTGIALDSYWISDIQEAPNKDVWISTQKGVFVSKGSTPVLNRKIDFFGVDEGMNDEMTYFLSFDDSGKLWVGTNNGVNQIDVPLYLLSGEKSIRSYGKNEGFQGIQTNHHAVYHSPDGYIWFGTVAGITKFDPSLDSRNDHEPITNLTNVRLFFESPDWAQFSTGTLRWSDLPDHPILPHNQNHLSFDFTGLSFSASQQVRYQYKLEGFDKTWSPITDQRSATFSNLPPGDYTFLVKASNNDGVWNSTPTAYSFTITAPFWDTWWFFALSGFGLFSGLIFLVRHNTRSFERRQRELEGMVAQQTFALEITNEALVEAKELALDAAKAKSEFLANMSHEIRTPMNGVVGFADLLMESNLEPQEREYVKIIQTNGDALLKILNHILDLSKVEAGKIDLENAPLSPRHCIEEALEVMTMEIEKKDIELAHFIDLDVPRSIYGDVTRLRQILVNLISNAIKFTEAGEVSIRLYVEETVSGLGRDVKHTLHFEVSDSGIGIPADKIDRLFDSFTQADASTTRKYGGTGLGLTISKGLCELMGGKMWIESEVGVGSTFHFTISAIDASLDGASDEPTGVQTNLKGARVLVIGALKTNRQALEAQLTDWGMSPVFADTNAQGLEWLDQGVRFELAIIDFHGSTFSGQELSRQIRKRPLFKDLPLLALAPLGKNAKECKIGSHFAGIVNKPIKQSGLFIQLSNILSSEKPTVVFTTTPLPVVQEKLATNHPLHILLAEDNVVNQRLFEITLERMGYSIAIASTGLEVLNLLRKRSFDVILMDMHMPEMDGIDATKAIIEEWSPENRPFIVALTAAIMKEDRERCQAAGMQGFLSKPMQTNELIEVLKMVPRLPGRKPRTSKPPVQKAQPLGKKSSIEKTVQNDL